MQSVSWWTNRTRSSLQRISLRLVRQGTSKLVFWFAHNRWLGSLSITSIPWPHYRFSNPFRLDAHSNPWNMGLGSTGGDLGQSPPEVGRGPTWMSVWVG